MPANEYPKVQLGCFAYQVKAVSYTGKISHNCGYVMFPEVLSPFLNIESISWHGGTTFDKVEDDTRVIGFDCAHAGDDTGDQSAENFRDYWYAERECKSCIRQLCEQLCGQAIA